MKYLANHLKIIEMGWDESPTDKAFYIREVERITGEDHGNVSRELQNLEGISLLIRYRQGNLRYFQLNRQFVLYDELRSMYLKTRGVAAGTELEKSG